MNSNQKKLQQMIKDQTLTLTDEELFLSSAYQKYLSSMQDLSLWCGKPFQPDAPKTADTCTNVGENCYE